MNRRWFALVLMMALIPGCSGRKIETAPSEALYETKPTDPVGFSSFYEVAETDGAVHAVTLDISQTDGFRFMGNDVVLFSGYGNTELTLLDRHTFSVKAEATLPQSVSAEDPSVTVGSEGITYVDDTGEALVFLNTSLKEEKRFPLPEDCTNTALSADQRQLYYCTPQGFRVFDLVCGIDRPIREMHLPCQEIVSLHCDDTLLQCRAINEDGNLATFFFSTETGSLLHESLEDVPLWTEDDLYFSIHMDGEYRELLSGSRDFGPSVLVTESAPITVTPVLSQRSVLLHRQQADGTTAVDAYHLETGIRTATLTLPDKYQIIDIQPDPAEENLWLLCHDSSLSKDILCRWDLTGSNPDDPNNYLQPRWNPEDPDREGLSQCRNLAAQLSEKHGVQILIWADASALNATGYRATAEYQVPLIRQMLQELDASLSCYPEGFLKELALPTDSGRLNISLVRSIQQTGFTETTQSSLLYRDNQSNIWLFVTADQNLTRQMNRLLCDLIDSRVLGLSDAYDSWDRSSPSGSGHQERVLMLETAMTDGNAAYFSSGFMQSQLRQLCFGIRETFQTADSADRLFWEQYLAPIS